MKISWTRLLAMLMSFMAAMPAAGTDGNGGAGIGEVLLADAAAVVEKINPGHKYLNFAFITDTHINGLESFGDVSAVNNLQMIHDIGNTEWCDFIVHGGDIYTAYGTTLEEAEDYIGQVKEMIGETTAPVYYTRGNHEANMKCRKIADPDSLDWEHTSYYVLGKGGQYIEVTEETWNGRTRLYLEETDNEQRISGERWVSLLQSSGMEGTVRCPDPAGGYFYRDFEEQKVRLIVANTFDSPHGNENTGMGREQTKWLAESALNLSEKVDPSEWTVVMFGHIFREGEGKRFRYLDVIRAFIEGKDFREKVDGTAVYGAFSGQGPGSFAGTIHGHRHRDEYSSELGWNNIGTLCGNGPTDTVGAPEEYGISVYTLDTDAKILYETRIGRRSDPERTEDRCFRFDRPGQTR